MAAPPTYMHDIRSIRDVHPDVPAVLANVDLNRRLQANTPINHAALDHAQGVVAFLKGAKRTGGDPIVTDAIIQSAESRVRAIETAHAAAEYTPVNIAQELHNINNRLGELTANNTTRFDQLTAMAHNNRILTRNAQRRGQEIYLPLRKTITGHGFNLAWGLAHSDGARNQLAVPNPVAAVNTTPEDFDPDISSYDHHYILRLIIFYNEDFGILPGDTLQVRAEKFRRFLTEM